MTIFRGQNVFIAERGRFEPASIHTERGVIDAVQGYHDVPPGAPVVDAGDLFVLPGVVDSHVHINEPGRTEWEGFDTATRAAAAGGITTVVDMPLNAIPPTTTLAGLTAKRQVATGKTWVDLAFWGGVVPGNDGELEAMRDAGACGFKCFLAPSGVDEFPCVSERDLGPALEILAHSQTPLLVHAELPGPLARAEPLARARSPVSYLSYLASRPPDAEDEAVALMIRLARATGARVHIVHHASATGLPLLHAARDNGVAISAETCPHYLHFAAEAIPDGATVFKCAPPIREAEVREKLWLGLGQGILGMVVSDHSPCTPELKKLESGDFFAAWGGIASLQLSLAATWTEARRRGHRLEALPAWVSEAPAALAGLSHKGRLAPGKDADLIFFAPNESFVADPARLFHKNRISPYAGDALFGVVRATFLRGEKIYGDGQFTGPPRGQLLSRQ